MKTTFKSIVLAFCVLVSFSTTALALTDDQQTEKLSQDQLEKLLAPIALYPDPLLAQLLPASTYPLEVIEAARLIHDEKDFDKIDAQDWDPSVQAIAHYPSVLKKMNDDLDWTQKLGMAFLEQQDDVMETIQTLRQQAEKAGNLKTTKEHVVRVVEKHVEILPADPEIIYVPVYNPTVVYVTSYVPVVYPVIHFGIGYHFGAWLNLGFYWPSHTVFYCPSHYWYPSWYSGHSHHTTVYNVYNTNIYRSRSVAHNVWKHNSKHGSPYQGRSQTTISGTSQRGSSTRSHSTVSKQGSSTKSQVQAQNLQNFKQGLSRKKTTTSSNRTIQSTTHSSSSSHGRTASTTQKQTTTHVSSNSHGRTTTTSNTQNQTTTQSPSTSRHDTVAYSSGHNSPTSSHSSSSQGSRTHTTTQNRSSSHR